MKTGSWTASYQISNVRSPSALAASSEGLLLDPVYTGKAMAGLVDLVRKGTFNDDENVIFLHTGGSPALFAYRSAFDGL